MPQRRNQILTAAQMRDAEEALIAGGVSVDELMQRAGRGAADYVWRIAAHRPVTVLCGPGNNGGDGYVIAEALRGRGLKVAVIAASEPKTDAARTARSLFKGEVLGPEATPHGEVFVDCLFGSGLVRPLSDAHLGLIQHLAANRRYSIAVDLPSGVQSDSGELLNPGVPEFDLTIALGAWKYAHFLMPACASIGALRLVDIGVGLVPDAASRLARPKLAAPAADTHKYRRGLLAVVIGAMPGAGVLAAVSAQSAGAGYVKLLGEGAPTPAELVTDARPLAEAIAEMRLSALLVGPGLGRDAAARERLAITLARDIPTVLDADALMLLGERLLTERSAPLIATPHEGELATLERSFGLESTGTKIDRAVALARESGMIVVAKGPDTVIAAPDGRIVCTARGSSWLSTAGTGDVLAGTIVSRLATGAEPFTAACEGVWLHSEAARLCPAPFTAGQLAGTIRSAYAACL